MTDLTDVVEDITDLANAAKREIMICSAHVASTTKPADRDWQDKLDPAHVKVNALRDIALRQAMLYKTAIENWKIENDENARLKAEVERLRQPIIEDMRP